MSSKKKLRQKKYEERKRKREREREIEEKRRKGLQSGDIYIMAEALGINLGRRG